MLTKQQITQVFSGPFRAPILFELHGLLSHRVYEVEESNIKQRTARRCLLFKFYVFLFATEFIVVYCNVISLVYSWSFNHCQSKIIITRPFLITNINI